MARLHRLWISGGFRGTGCVSYLRYWLEAFRLPAIPPADILGRMRAAGEEQTAFRHLAAGRGVISALPHMGNWEHAGA